MNEIVRDNGVKSRKLWFSVFSIAVIAVIGLAAGSYPGIVSIYSALVGGIVAVAGLYMTGNVTQKWVGAQAQPGLVAAAAAPKPAPKALTDTHSIEPAVPPASRFPE
jgi:disulfide bond formation protein DsbB